MEPEVVERFERLEANLNHATDAISALIQLARSHEERLDRLTESQARTDEQIKQTQELIKQTQEEIRQTQGELTILIRMMDDWIRRNPRNGKGQTPAA